MSYKFLLYQINNDFKALFENEHLADILEKLKWQHPLPDDLKIVSNTYGLYLFTIDRSMISNLEEFEKLWQGGDNTPLYTPKVIKKNFEKCLILNEERLPLYLGKTEKLQTRLENHINGKRDSKTYSLKLRQRSNLDLSKIQLAYYEIPFDIALSPEIKQLYLTTLEQKLRNKLFPLVGKK